MGSPRALKQALRETALSLGNLISSSPAQLCGTSSSSSKSQVLLFSEAKKTYAEAVGQTGAQGLVRGCGPHCPPVSRKKSARDEASGAPCAGRGSASFWLISGVRVLSLALSGRRPGFRGGGNPISIDHYRMSSSGEDITRGASACSARGGESVYFTSSPVSFPLPC